MDVAQRLAKYNSLTECVNITTGSGSFVKF
jgi:hypothetical protein